MSQQLRTESQDKTPQRSEPRETRPAAAPSWHGGLHPILQLQRLLGNRRVAQVIHAKRLTPDGKMIGLQRKLTVGAADDPYEQEADRVARHVLNTSDAVAAHAMQRAVSPEEDQDQMLQTKPLAASITPFVQRQMVHNEGSEDKEKPVQAKFFPETSREPLQQQPDTEEDETELIQAKSAGALTESFEAGADVETQVSQSKGRGSPLPDPVRAYMEPRFGVDFSQVRVHTGSDAIQMNREVGAQAFTHGTDIYFGAGQSPSNVDLTAHELTHVVQQTGGGAPLGREKGPLNFLSTRAVEGPVGHVLELQRSPGNRYVAQHLARRPVSPTERSWEERATSMNARRARSMDEFEQFTDEELLRQRTELESKAVGHSGDDQQAALEELEDVEGVIASRDLEVQKLDLRYFNNNDFIKRRRYVRQHLEEGIRRTGSYRKAKGEFGQLTKEMKSDLEFFDDEKKRFESHFYAQANSTALRMLNGSLVGVEEILKSYGLPVEASKSAAKQLQEDDDLDDAVDRVIKAANESKEVNEEKRVVKRVELANKAQKLRQLQQLVAQREKELDQAETTARSSGTGAGSRDPTPDPQAKARLTAVREELLATWVATERLHPVLASFRRGSDVSKVDIKALETHDVEAEMRAVLRQLLPKLRDIGIARDMVLRNPKRFNALSLPSVVALTRANMFIPPGSLRDGFVTDIASDASDDSNSTLMTILAFALAIVTLIPSAGASLAIPAGAVAVSLGAYAAHEEWQKYKRLQTFSNTNVDLARSLVTEDPTLTKFAFALVAAGFEALPLVSAWNKIRRMRRLVSAGDETTEVVRDLNRLGKQNGRPRLGDEALAEVKATTHVLPPKPKPKPRSEGIPSATPKKGRKPKTDKLNDPDLNRPVDYDSAGDMASGMRKAMKEKKLKVEDPDSNPMMRELLDSAWAQKLTGREKPTLQELTAAAHKIKHEPTRRMIEQLSAAYRALRDPRIAEETAYKLWNYAAQEGISTRQAMEKLLGVGSELKEIEEFEKFRKVVGGRRSFRDLAFAHDTHGAHTHMFQELMLEHALGKGGGREFRRLIAEAQGPAFKLRDDPAGRPFFSQVWDSVFDVGEPGFLNHPETLGKILQEHLGLPRWKSKKAVFKG